jgi:hypothetical protein
MTIRAAPTSYLVLTGIWVLLAIGYLFLSIRSPGENLESGALIAGGVAILWWIWLRGFKITVSEGCLEYRDGFFRSSKIALSEIADVKTESVGWNLLGQKLRIPRITVITRNGEMPIRINPKPFGRLGLQRIMKELKKTKIMGTAYR